MIALVFLLPPLLRARRRLLRHAFRIVDFFSLFLPCSALFCNANFRSAHRSTPERWAPQCGDWPSLRTRIPSLVRIGNLTVRDRYANGCPVPNLGLGTDHQP